MRKIIYFFKQSWLLLAASFIFGLLVAVANYAWSPRILLNDANKFDKIASAMLTDANSFETIEEPVELKLKNGSVSKTTVKKALDSSGNCAGFAFICEGAGFADKIKLVLTVDSKFDKIVGYGVLFSNETPGFGDKIKEDFYKDQFAGAPAKNLELTKTGGQKKAAVIDSEIVAISGATVSSQAVIKIINTYTSQIKQQLQQKGILTNDSN